MKNSLRITVYILLILFISTFPLLAQTNIFFTSYLIKDDNTYKNKNAHDEWMNSSSLLVGHRFGSESFKVQGYYNADFLLFKNNKDLNNYSHKFGISGTLLKDDLTINAAVFAKIDKFQELLNYYNVNKYNLSVNMQYNPDLQNFYSAGIIINRENYTEFQDLDNLSYNLSGMYQRFFQSKLSLTAQVSLGLKDYFNQSVINYFGMAGGSNRLMRYREDPVQAVIFSLSGIVGKSITENLGISLGMGGQWFLGNPIESYSNGIYYYTESDLFDDPYSYQDKYITLQLTNQFAVDFQGKIGVKYQSKDYSGTPALDENGDLTGGKRQDTRKEYFLMVTKKFETDWVFPSSISLFFNFMYRDNPSNDPYYDFKDHVFLLGFALGM